MASANRSLLVALALAVASPLRAQTPAPSPVRLSFAGAVREATGVNPDTAPAAVTIAGFRRDAAGARVRQARATLLPSLSVTGSWVNRTFNPRTLGFEIPGFNLPSLVPPFNAYDGRARVTQTLFDLSSVSRVSAARGLFDAANAERTAVLETAAQNVALAYARAVRAQAVVAARQADSALAAELVTLAVAQQQAGVSASIDVTRAKTQLADAAGALVVAANQLDRARIDLARALGLDPGTPILLTDSLSAELGAADVPADRATAVAQAVAARPDLVAERARGTAARRAASAISAERLPRLDLEADYGFSGLRLPDAVGTRQLALEITLPILDGFRREGRRAEQDAVVRESEVRVRDLGQQVAADVDGALLDLRSAGAQQQIAAERLQLAAQEVSEARQRFKAGVAGNIEVINAQSSLLRARDADIDARFAAVAARIALARSVGSARTLH
ncbi:MAG TPA: TolC family protein [Gemmatimonadales bacterium]|jgi:outer membrane protein TolC|nr:TolC family protein [Gemmatimonadales bacterium]